jgi:hypothetical protein
VYTFVELSSSIRLDFRDLRDRQDHIEEKLSSFFLVNHTHDARFGQKKAPLSVHHNADSEALKGDGIDNPESEKRLRDFYEPHNHRLYSLLKEKFNLDWRPW